MPPVQNASFARPGAIELEATKSNQPSRNLLERTQAHRGGGGRRGCKLVFCAVVRAVLRRLLASFARFVVLWFSGRTMSYYGAPFPARPRRLLKQCAGGRGAERGALWC